MYKDTDRHITQDGRAGNRTPPIGFGRKLPKRCRTAIVKVENIAKTMRR